MTNYTVSSGVTSSGITLLSGDGMVVLSGGTALAITSDPGGLTVDLGGTAISTTLEAGGLQDLNGIAIDTTIDSGGHQFVNFSSGHGVASNTRVNSLGIMSVDSGGTAIGAFVANGGFAEVLAGGNAVGTTIVSGGEAAVSAAGVASNTTISGGVLYLQSGATESGPITFAGSGGVLAIGGTAMPFGVISGLAIGDSIDLLNVSLASGGGIYLSGGNLNVSGGGSAYVLQLDPATNLSGASFRLTSDGGSGTDIEVVSGLSINVSYDASVMGAGSATQSGIMSGVSAAVDYLESTFTNAVTLNLDVGYGEFNGSPLDSGALGENNVNGIVPFSYSATASALKAHGSTAAQNQAYGTLPATSPDSGALWLVPAEQQLLGLAPANGVAVDGYVGFSTSNSFSYAPHVTPPSSAFYFVGVAEHEFSEVMGRVSYLNSNINGSASYSIMDLFRFSSSGSYQTSTGAPPTFPLIAASAISTIGTTWSLATAATWETGLPPRAPMRSWITAIRAW